MAIVTKIIFEVVVGVFLVFVWNIDIDSIGCFRWLVGWVFGVTLLVDILPKIQRTLDS